MNRTLLATFAAAIAFGLAGSRAEPAPGKAPAPHKPVHTLRRPMLLADYGGNQVCRVDEAGKIVWRMEARKPMDVWLLADGNVMYTYLRGVRIASPQQKVVWEYEVDRRSEVHACQPLARGNVMIAESGPMRIIEVTPAKKIVKEVKLTTNTQRTHTQMRCVRKLDGGNYLVGQFGDSVLREYDPNGKIVRDIPQKQIFGGIRAPGGNTILACGDTHTIKEVDARGKVVWQVTENDLPGIPLRFVAGLCLTAEGNLIVANWGGHGHVGEQPQVFEVTRDEKKKVVGLIYDNEQFKTISGVFVIEKR